MDDHLLHLMEREINLMRLISANRQALEQAVYINQLRYVDASKREEERLQANLAKARAERSEEWPPQWQLDVERQKRFDQLHRELVHWEQKLDGSRLAR